MLPPCLFTLHADYIMQNVQPDDSQGGIKITRRNISNLRYADDITLMAESEKEPNGLLMKGKDDGIRSCHFMANRWGNVKTVSDFIWGGSKINVVSDCSHEIKRRLFLER